MPGEVIRLFGTGSSGEDARPVGHIAEESAFPDVTTCRQEAELPPSRVPGEGKVIPLPHEVVAGIVGLSTGEGEIALPLPTEPPQAA